jgi:hypothetical protein
MFGSRLVSGGSPAGIRDGSKAFEFGENDFHQKLMPHQEHALAENREGLRKRAPILPQLRAREVA